MADSSSMPPLKYLVPNAFTAVSLLLGLGSVLMSVEGRFELAAWMILWATLLDKADGSAARLLRATSRFGMEFDSFADFVAFGIAPAALFHFKLSSHFLGWHHTALMIACGLYVVALAVRLSRFNVITTAGETHFVGVPGTLLGAVLASGFLTAVKYGLPDAVLDAAPALLVVASLLMISTFRLPKLKPRKSRAFNVFQYCNVAVAYVIGPLMLFPEYLCGLAVTYLVGGLVSGVITPEPEEEAEALAAE
jgi:CDP-diacylglycerol---serine O-phosphatidyltransferase